MLKGLSNNKARSLPLQQILIGMVIFLIGGCSYNTILSGMTAADLEMKQAGYHLECTDYRDKKCVVMDWINGNDTTNSAE